MFLIESLWPLLGRLMQYGSKCGGGYVELRHLM